ncbi:MAG: hypothetical protein L0K86_22865, partial [Actinomycetia bacterium]|nr:hypothetical protein [Actinomycetes bacterium]
MTKKKTAAVVAVAFGLTATATGSYATTSSGGSEDAARTTAQHSAVKVDKLRTNVAKSTDAQSERRRCVGKKKMRRIRV